VTISVDTCKAEVARRAIGAGADIVNDITALRFDPELVDVVAETGVPVVLMHMLGSPKDMQADPRYQDCVGEIADFLRERIDFAVSHGIDRDRIIIDPGIGFGKRLIDNLDILARLRVLKQFSLPLMVGASRKRFIEFLHRSGSQPHERLGGSVAAAMLAVSNGADIVRAHDVRETAEALHLLEAVRGSE
jgi:dihydropteroate synthase